MRSLFIALFTGFIVYFATNKSHGQINNLQDSINHYISLTKSIEQTNLYKAEKFISRAVYFARKTNNDSIIAHALLKKAAILNLRGNLTEALPLLDTAKVIFYQQNNTPLFLQAMLEKGIALSNAGIPQNAAKELFAVVNHSECNDSLIYAKAFIQIGMLHYYQLLSGKSEKTKSYLQEGIRFFAKSHSPNHQAIAYNYEALRLDFMGSTKEAIPVMKKAIEINTIQKNNVALANNYHNIGYLYRRTADYSKAQKYFESALELNEKTGALLQKAFNYQSLAKVFIALGKYDEATNTLETLMRICNEKKYLTIGVYTTGALFSLYQNKKNYERSVHYLLYHNYLKDSLNNMESSSSNLNIVEQQFKFEKEAQKQEERIQNTIIRNRKRIIILLSIILFLGSILTLVYINLRNKRKWLRIFEEKNRVILLQSEEMKEMLHSLTISEQELKVANQAKKKLLSIIAHDLINPFNTIIGLSDLIISEETNADIQKTFISRINETSKEAYYLLDQLLTWSRIQSDKIKPSINKMAIASIAKQNYILYQPTAEAKKINLVDNIKEGITAYTDEVFLSTIVRNLVSNAVKFTHEGGSITISTNQSPDKATITVSDTGVGMSSEQLKKLIKEKELFSQRGTNKEKGTGLGLAICFEFAQKISANIKVESEMGEGTSFTIELPIHADDLQMEETAF